MLLDVHNSHRSALRFGIPLTVALARTCYMCMLHTATNIRKRTRTHTHTRARIRARACIGNMDLVSWLVENGADANQANHSGQSTLINKKFSSFLNLHLPRSRSCS